MTFFFVFTGVVICYLICILMLIWGWKKIAHLKMNKQRSPEVYISIIIPVRNEAAHLGALLTAIRNQTYPKEFVEVLVIDDKSTDQSAKIARQYIENLNINGQVMALDLPDDFNQSHKKKAISLGVEKAMGELIVCTDGDCLMSSSWLSSIANYYQTHSCVFLSGPVIYTSNGNYWQELLAIEFGSLIGVGMATINLGIPTMCNGANMSFTREIFEEVSGYDGFEHQHSGDDEFLLYKISKVAPGRVKCIQDKNALVTTKPAGNFSDFIQQRIRWAGKWKGHKNINVILTGCLIFFTNLGLFYLLWMAVYYEYIRIWVILALLSKWIIDYIFLHLIMKLFDKSIRIDRFLILEIFYPVYALFFGIVAQFKGYVWKGRKINHN